MRTQPRSGRLWRGVVASQEACGSQRRFSFHHEQPDGNLCRHCGPRNVEAAVQGHALQRLTVSGGRDHEGLGCGVEKEGLVAQQQGARKEH